ncbi:hypothetical protein [Streptomyces sp. TLI_146]|uniref:hypothetical protein n=1 Tax=Streptomyces sp. TLI_146 TaxID=1938858 RepID=UPI000CC56AE7|nr:hypothetical protein [Streptomyces sp. TLI_146]PKV89936.1 hypothetical protein BX283_7587 [Streptomyces sp. TLI_146]
MPTDMFSLPRRARRAIIVGFPLLLAVSLTSACTSMGGRVHSAADYRAHDVRTKQAGMDTVVRLRPAAQLAGTGPGATPEDAAHEEHSSSCVDDFGFDKDNVTRGEPSYSWTLRYATRADYLTALAHLRAGWKAEGLTVTDLPAGDGRPGRPGLPGIQTTDHGIELSLQQAWYTDDPTVYASGECMRYHAEQ